MTHEELEELLGAYALDATDPEERGQIEAHLSECPHCRAEVAAHLEMAALLGSAGTDAPAGLWEKIASSIAEDQPSGDGEPPAPVLQSNVFRLQPRPTRRSGRVGLSAAIGAIAAAVMVFLGVEVAQLHSKVDTLTTATQTAGLKSAALALATGPHQTIKLASADRQLAATVIVGGSGQAYWLWSSLRNLPSSQTYQLWGLSRGKPVSLGLVGDHPDAIDPFTVERGVSELMVTAEPEGGTPGPTTAVLAQGAVPPSAIS
jgi:hypothetical protein